MDRPRVWQDVDARRLVDAKHVTTDVRSKNAHLITPASYYIPRESQTTRNVLWSRACVSVCLSVRGRMPTVLRGPGCNLEEW